MLAVACSNDEVTPPEDEGRMKVNIVTRGSGEEVGSGDVKAGLFMVNYLDGRPDVLEADGNYVHNQQLTFSNGAWTSATPIYWSDTDTPADFYAYAPYQTTVTDALAMPFAVQADQRSQTAFAASDLMWGTLAGCSPTTESFDLTLSHVLSRLTVAVTAEQGFAEGELKADDVSVTIGGTRTHGTINLATGTISVLDGFAAEDVKCFSNGDLSYTAVLLPQNVPFANLVKVDWKGNIYTLQNSFLLEAARQYTLTVRLKRTQSGFDIGIEGWDIIEEDFGGSVGG